MQRLIVLGASNVTRSFGRLLTVAGDTWPGPLEVIAAHGHGRSFGALWSTVLVRKLPGILHCGLWEAASRSPHGPTAALVTDIGNDVLYEYPVSEIADWVERTFDRLLNVSDQMTVTALPIQNLEGLSPARYKFFLKLFMPGCALPLAETTRRVIDLNERVCALAKARGISPVPPLRAWYGADPLHIRQRSYRTVWQTVFGAFCSPPVTPGIPHFSREKRGEMILLRTRFPARVRWFGKEFRTGQPSSRLSNGTTIAQY